MIRLIRSRMLQSTWVVKNNVMCSIFWAGIIVVFMGMILLVTSKHKGTVFKSWGGVVTGIGFCMIIVCILLCIHSYLVSANTARTEKEFNSMHTDLKNLRTISVNSARSNGKRVPRSKIRRPPRFKNVNNTFVQLNNANDAGYINRNSAFDHKIFPIKDVPNKVSTDNHRINTDKIGQPAKHSTSGAFINVPDQTFMPDNQFPNGGMPKLSITRNFGASTITVTPLYHKNYLQNQSDYNDPEKIAMSDNVNSTNIERVFPTHDSDDLTDSNINHLTEIADSKATVYENVQYYNM